MAKIGNSLWTKEDDGSGKSKKGLEKKDCINTRCTTRNEKREKAWDTHSNQKNVVDGDNKIMNCKSYVREGIKYHLEMRKETQVVTGLESRGSSMSIKLYIGMYQNEDRKK